LLEVSSLVTRQPRPAHAHGLVVGTIFGPWTAERVRPWLLAIVAPFGPDRCMLGSDLPIERLRSGFEPLYRAYDEIFAGHTPLDREMLLGTTAEQWYGTG
jgi:predicted TIM-barrel fold metal-dependent hydrolase